MFPYHELVAAVLADREREIRSRGPRYAGIASGPRHPAAPEHGTLDRGRAASAGSTGGGRRAGWLRARLGMDGARSAAAGDQPGCPAPTGVTS